MLQVKNICKAYKKGLHEIKAIDDISIAIPAGDFISIVGQSGSGKSSLLLTLGGMLSPSSGSVSIDNHSLYDLSPLERSAIRRKKIGFVFQTFNLIPYLTALQNVQVPLLLNGVNQELQYKIGVTLLERFGLSNRLEHKPSELSVGQQQRVALARMLANNPEIILADEPTGNLDSETSHQVLNFLKEINQEGKTIILVTHDMKVAEQAKKTLTISEGKILGSVDH
jgi:putative ABC transport system ATP-binding protein